MATKPMRMKMRMKEQVGKKGKVEMHRDVFCFQSVSVVTSKVLCTSPFSFLFLFLCGSIFMSRRFEWSSLVQASSLLPASAGFRL